MLYATEVLPLSECSLKSLDFCVRQVVAKVFSVQDNNCITEIGKFCDLPYIGVLIERWRLQFVKKLFADEQLTYLFRLRLFWYVLMFLKCFLCFYFCSSFCVCIFL